MLTSDCPISDLFSVVCPFEGLFLTKTGGLIGAVELSGIDADTLITDDLKRVAFLRAAISSGLPEGISVTEYFVHVDGSTVSLKERDDPLFNRLSQGRMNALNERGVSLTRLVHVLHYEDQSGLNGSFFKMAGQAITDPKTIKSFWTRLKNSDALLLRESELSERVERLNKAIDDYRAKWSKLVDAKKLNVDEFWTFMKFLGTQDPKYLAEKVSVPAPQDDCDLVAAAGDIHSVRLDYNDALRLEGPKARYCRIASVTKQPETPYGIWTGGNEPIIKQRGNYTLVTHFSRMTEFERSLKFRTARNVIERGKLDLYNMLTGKEETSGEERLNLRKRIEELEEAEALEDSFGYHFIKVIVADEDPKKLKKVCDRFDSAMTFRGLFPTWEGPVLHEAFQAVQPGGHVNSMRLNVTTLSRASAMSLVYRSSVGKRKVAEIRGEEAEYIFETESGEPFYFSGYHGDRCMIIGVGPTRSGKTFLKNTRLTHFLKYGGFSRVIDVDHGTETVADFLGSDRAGLFRVKDDEQVVGLNPFVSVADLQEGGRDVGFATHVSNLVMLMLEANDTPEAQIIQALEQKQLDKAIEDTMRLPPDMRSFGHLFAHLPPDFTTKLSRWGEGGRYDGILNAKLDGIGALNKSLSVFNLQQYLDNQNVLRPLLLEIFYRITREFVDPANRSIPKLMEIDEAHNALRIPVFRDYIIQNSRKWAKYGAGLTLWSQSPREYRDTKDWPAIRSAATTFIFMADGQMVPEDYKETFGLTPGQIETISQLIPRREALIVQPEQGISKKVILQTEPEQYVINTSSPNEVALRQRLISEFGLEKGLVKAAQAIEEIKQSEAA